MDQSIKYMVASGSYLSQSIGTLSYSMLLEKVALSNLKLALFMPAYIPKHNYKKVYFEQNMKAILKVWSGDPRGSLRKF